MYQKITLYLLLAGAAVSILLMRLHPVFAIANLCCGLGLCLLACGHLNRSQTDALTGVGNRHYLNQLRPHYRKIASLTAVYVDLDDLKRINDIHGHAAGNKALAEVGAALQAVCRRDERVYRMGGDEFLLLSKSADANSLAARMAQAQTSASLSYGIAAGSGADLDALIQAAEKAMYTMKKQVP